MRRGVSWRRATAAAPSLEYESNDAPSYQNIVNDAFGNAMHKNVREVADFSARSSAMGLASS